MYVNPNKSILLHASINYLIASLCFHDIYKRTQDVPWTILLKYV